MYVSEIWIWSGKGRVMNLILEVDIINRLSISLSVPFSDPKYSGGTEKRPPDRPSNGATDPTLGVDFMTLGYKVWSFTNPRLTIDNCTWRFQYTTVKISTFYVLHYALLQRNFYTQGRIWPHMYLLSYSEAHPAKNSTLYSTNTQC